MAPFAEQLLEAQTDEEADSAAAGMLALAGAPRLCDGRPGRRSRLGGGPPRGPEKRRRVGTGLVLHAFRRSISREHEGKVERSIPTNSAGIRL